MSQALVWNVGTYASMLSGKLTSERLLGGKYRCGDRGGATCNSDETFVMKEEQRGSSSQIYIGQPKGMNCYFRFFKESRKIQEAHSRIGEGFKVIFLVATLL